VLFRSPAFFDIDSLKDAMDAFKKEFIRSKVAALGNNHDMAAKTMGISVDYLKKILDSIS
jgi:transcriptional regulator with PAS, ATPase and Fis domain